MKAITERIIGLTDLLEAEGKLLQKKTVRTGVILLGSAVAALFFIAAIILIMTGGYYFLIEYFSLPQVFWIMSAFCLFLTIIVIEVIVRLDQ